MIVSLNNIGNFLKDILDSTITSNAIAIVSLVVTFQTMKSAKDINEEMKKMQIDALEKSRFMQEKPKIIKSLERHSKSITKGSVAK